MERKGRIRQFCTRCGLILVMCACVTLAACNFDVSAGSAAKIHSESLTKPAPVVVYEAGSKSIASADTIKPNMIEPTAISAVPDFCTVLSSGETAPGALARMMGRSLEEIPGTTRLRVDDKNGDTADFDGNLNEATNPMWSPYFENLPVGTDVCTPAQ
jgi:hypothetical protein